jgi:PAS domain S-box-containing protein
LAKSAVESLSEVVVDLTEKAPIQVLHVDDESGFLKVVKQCLEMEGAFQVDTAVSVEEALEKMMKKKFDVIVSDYMIPEKDGLEFLKQLREKGNNIPFIIFTGKGREEVAIDALNLGADQYLNKIGDPETVYGELAHGICQAVKAKQAEEALRESEERYRRLFEEALDTIFVADAETGILIDCNRAASELVGREKSELIGKHQRILHPPREIKEEFSRTFKQHLKEKEGQVLETQVITKKGEIKDVAIKANVFELRGKKVIQGIFRDITKRKRFEERLSALNTYSRDLNMAETMEEVYQLTLDAKEKTLGFEHASFMVVDENMLCIVDQRGYPESLSVKLPLNEKRGVTVKAAKTGKPVLVPDTKKEKAYVEGMPGIRSELAVPIKIGHRVLGVLNVESKRLDAFDEKDQKLLEIWASHAATAISNLEYAKNLEMHAREIRESQEKFERLFMNNPEAAVYLDPDSNILDVNPRFSELFGYAVDEIKDKHINDVIVQKDKMEEAEMLDKKSKGGYIYYDTVRKRKDGSLVPISMSSAPITIEGKIIGYVVLYKGITERKKAEEELEESRRHFQTLFNLMVDPVAIVDKKGKILEVTQRAEEITGFKREELLGKNFLRTKIATAKSKAILIKNLAKRMMGMHIAPYEVEMLTKDGRKLPHEVNAAKIEYKGKPADLVVFRDISERKKMEEKLRVVGKLTRHDIRNKLSAVTGNVFLAKRKLTSDHEALEYLSEIESACRQVERIFDFARTYEKLGAEELAYMDVEKSLEEAVMLFSGLHGVKVVNDCRGLTVLADSLLRQLFYNLIDNSVKHGEKVKKIRVYYEEIREGQLKLVYEDDGVGIPKAEKEKIFKEGYGKGTGHGLYLIRKMCEVYGWTIRETGKHGKGAQFTITIPKVNDNMKENYRLH